jgi:hypothetical protein
MKPDIVIIEPFPTYKGFYVNIKRVDEAWIGIALCKEEDGKEINFNSGFMRTEREVGKLLYSYIDMYRKVDKQKLVVN